MHPTNSHIKTILTEILEEIRKVKEILKEIKDDSGRAATRKKDTL